MTNGMKVLAVEAEQIEVLLATGFMKKEKPQSDFKGGWLDMYTTLKPFVDHKGRNREPGATFTLEGLRENGIVAPEVK